MLSPDLTRVAAELTSLTISSGAKAISTRVASAKVKKDQKVAINELSEIINDLISDNGELTRIAKIYEQELAERTISEEDIDYITQNVIPVLERLLDSEQDQTKKRENEKYIIAAKALLSTEMVTTAQLLGFNFKLALGRPLTELVSKSISSLHATADLEVKKLNLENVNLLEKIALDTEAYNRYCTLVGREDLIERKISLSRQESQKIDKE